MEITADGRRKYRTSATATGGGRDGRTALAGGTPEFQLVISKNSVDPAVMGPIRKAFLRSVTWPASSAHFALVLSN
jgi:hypothetical protein